MKFEMTFDVDHASRDEHKTNENVLGRFHDNSI